MLFRSDKVFYSNVNPQWIEGTHQFWYVRNTPDGRLYVSVQLIGAAQRVPTPTGSTTILNAVVAKKVTVDEVNAAMKAAATESFGYNTEQIVSSDIVGMRFGSLFDATQTMVNELPNGGCQVQVVSWYDNENSYTSQMVRTIKYFAELN